MWNLICQESSSCLRYLLKDGETAVTYHEALNLFRSNEKFRAFFINFLQQVPFKAYKWETPAYSTRLLNRAFEFVILNSPTLDRPASLSAFKEFIGTTNVDVVTFPNLNKDAHLVVPSCADNSANYCHLGAFSKSAPLAQQQRLWAAVGETGLALVSDKPVWLSTAGGGVPWLHIRFDNKPKYYGHAAYTKV